ncbi:hypothetical protein ElyMa_002336200 [Elysia marginata]|uniref:Mos1 transposase HTH domain-containing protein n=1 Tax=Elysia marginata TaxID=1093978 RepID=A0AAV4G9E2_9GAST|nr:hypothetical protein ElyMa_002336200 [Elysia marginata]
MRAAKQDEPMGTRTKQKPQKMAQLYHHTFLRKHASYRASRNVAHVAHDDLRRVYSAWYGRWSVRAGWLCVCVRGNPSPIAAVLTFFSIPHSIIPPRVLKTNRLFM